jgi:hypothetical protein
MRRPGWLKLKWWQIALRYLSAGLRALPGMVIAALFIGVSGVASVTFGYKLGEPSGNALIFAAVALGVEGFADLAVPLFWHRIRLGGRALLFVFFTLCLTYKLTAANRFAAENLGKREAAVATQATDFDLAKDKVDGLRKIINANIDARPAASLTAEINKLLRDPKAEGCTGKINGKVTGEICPKVDALRGELAKAEARDKAQAELPAAIATLRSKPAVAAPVAQDDLGIVGTLLGLIGLHLASWSDFVAHLFMALVEGGAIIVPMLVGLANGGSRETWRPSPAGDLQETLEPQRSPEKAVETLETRSPQASTKRLTERAERDVADVTAFLGDGTERAVGEGVQSMALYLNYCGWKHNRGEKPITVAQFGTVLTQHLGLTKGKIAGKIQYESLRLKSPQPGNKVSPSLPKRRLVGRLVGGA